MDPVGLLLWLIVLVVVFGVAYWVISLIPLPPPLRTALLVALGLVLLLIVLQAFAPTLRRGP